MDALASCCVRRSPHSAICKIIGLLVCGPADTTIPDRAPDDQAARSRTRCTTPGSASPSPSKG